MAQTVNEANVLAALFVIAPQFSTTDSTCLARYQALYNLLLCQFNAAILSCCGVLAFAYLMANYLSIQYNTGVDANLKEGELSVGFNVNPDIQFLNLTPYGRAYLDLIRRTVVGTTVTNLPVPYGGIIQNMPLGCGCNSGAGWGFGNANSFGGGCCSGGGSYGF